MKIDLEQLKGKNLPRVQWSDLFKAEGLSPEDAEVLTDYFSHFTPLVDRKCPGCNSNLAAESEIMAWLGQSTFTWGIVHGEGFCSKCRYPARAYHRDIGPIKFFNCILPYHPSELSEKKADI